MPPLQLLLVAGISSLGRIRENLFRGPRGWKKLSLTGVWEGELFLTKYRLLLCLDGQFLRTRIDANGPSLRFEGDSYSFKSSIVKLTIEIKVHSK